MKCRALVAGCSVGLVHVVSSVASAQGEGGQLGNDMADHTKEATEKIAATLKKAIKGEPEAIQTLMSDYVFPAAVAIVTLFVAYMVASFIGRWIGTTVSQKVDKTFGKFVGKAIRNVIMAGVLFMVLQKFGIDVASFAAVIAAVGFAIGMAFQGTLSNFAAGIMLLVFRPFKVDDYIVVAGTEGTVEEIDMFTTRLNTLDNRHVIVPNSEIFGSQMENYTRNEFRRVDVNVGAAYSADIEMTRRVLEQAIANIPGGVAVPEPQVYLCELGDSAVAWQCRVWCRPTDYWAVRQDMTQAAKQSLDQAGIGIPFPQVDVNVIGKVLARAA